MQKILIGVSAPNNKTSQAAIAQLADVFTLNHLNMRQPIINMIAALTEIDKTAQEFYCSQDHMVDHLGINIEQLEISISLSLRTFNREFFIKHCDEAIEHARRGFLGELFSGQIISGIKTDLEAQWIRDNGGQVVHLSQYDDAIYHNPLNELDGDLVCVIEQPSPTPDTSELIAQLREKIYPAKQAA